MKKKLIFLFLLLLFFILQDALRIFPSLIKEELLAKFHWTATDYGLFTALYYIGYSGIHIPISLGLDKYGLQKIVTSSILVTGIGMLFLTFTHNPFIALFSRFLIGLGSSVAFLSIVKVANNYFESKKDLVISFCFSLGLLGYLSNVPMSFFLAQNYAWESLSLFLTFATFIVGFFAFLFLPPLDTKIPVAVFKLQDFIRIITNKKILLLGLINFLMVGALEGFSDIWGFNYLVEIYQLDKSISAQIMSFIFIGLLFGSPVLAFLAKVLGYYKVIILSGLILALGVALFPLVPLSLSQMLMISFILGIFSCYQIPIIILGSDLIKNSTLPVGILNSVNMLGGGFFHWIVGYSLDYLTPYYAYNQAFSFALLTIPLAALLGSFVVFFIKK